mmetsp:Transcript_79435/g.199621  ORF Transcript_79435/g.199621 Transcript_79435/m.199621 type:complete len:223 (-) Transcript_79435:2291-2959(-)
MAAGETPSSASAARPATQVLSKRTRALGPSRSSPPRSRGLGGRQASGSRHLCRCRLQRQRSQQLRHNLDAASPRPPTAEQQPPAHTRAALRNRHPPIVWRRTWTLKCQRRKSPLLVRGQEQRHHPPQNSARTASTWHARRIRRWTSWPCYLYLLHIQQLYLLHHRIYNRRLLRCARLQQPALTSLLLQRAAAQDCLRQWSPAMLPSLLLRGMPRSSGDTAHH